jgi:signal recognition particle subunit SRP54
LIGRIWRTPAGRSLPDGGPIGGFYVREKSNVFESLTTNLQDAFKKMRRRGKLRSADIDEALRDVRLALLDADVHYQVVKDLIDSVRQSALGEEVSKALNPGQQVIRIIHQEIVRTLGSPEGLNLQGAKPRVVMLVGIQGSGKTTTTAKLAGHLKKQGERVWMIAADPYRPAAIEQLELLGEEIGVPVFSQVDLDPPALCREGVRVAKDAGASVVLLDTAGRSQIDSEMMEELMAIYGVVAPVEILLVADAMTGQEAINIAQGFSEKLSISGLILTKMDGDARGGAAISMRTVTGVPIKFIGIGESLKALETFNPERMASRILGMGDVLSIIERAEERLEAEAVEQHAERLLKGEFTLEDFASQLASVRKLGSVGKLLESLPVGVSGAVQEVDSQGADRQLMHTQAILSSMTIKERMRPEILNASRKRRIAAGSGTSVQEVNQLLRQYRQMQKLFKQFGKRGMPDISRMLR